MRSALALLPFLVACATPNDPANVASGAPSTPMKTASPFAEHATELAKNPEGLSLSVRTADGKTTFFEGQRIGLELLFSSSKAGTYKLDMACYDRSGRLWTETFHFDRAGDVADPLADYFGQMRGGMGGIAAMSPTLDDEPVAIELTLNEWVRFHKPGSHRFFVQSTRVSSGPEQGVVSSNVVELEIVSDPAWQDKELARIQAVLEREASEEVHQEARRALRFLTSLQAARVMVDDLCAVPMKDDEYRWASHAGLFGSRHRAEVVKMLLEGLSGPDCAVTPEYVRTVGKVDQGHSSEHLMMLLDALAKKSDRAKPSAVYTALTTLGESTGKTVNELEPLRASLGAVLGKLSETTLERALVDQWSLVRSPVLAAPLLSLVKEARPRGSRLRSTSDLALERLVEIDYASARTFILAEVARPGAGARLSFSGATLGLLKDAELPDLDAAFVNGVKSKDTDAVSLEQRAELFARYASGKVLKDAWAAYKGVAYFRISLLAYLAKNDPEAAGKEMLELEDFDSIQRLSKFVWNATLERIVIGRLQGADGSQAAALLALRGSAISEGALWVRLKTERTGELASALRNAVTMGKAWSMTPEKFKALADTCSDDECKSQIESSASRWGTGGERPQLVLWSVPSAGGVTGWLGHYDVRTLDDLKTRIEQLPAGLTLEWGTKPEDVDAKVMDDVRRWAKARKIEVVSKAPLGPVSRDR